MSFILGLLAILVPLAGALGSQFGIWSFGLGLQSVLLACVIGIIGVASSLFGLIASLIKRHKNPGLFHAGGGILSGGLLLYAGSYILVSVGLPSIHNISTDLENPPVFSQAMIEKRGQANPVEMEEGVKELQRLHYPSIQSWESAQTPEEIRPAVDEAIEELGWERQGSVVAEDSGVETIYATDTTFWFEFKDDVAIRLTATETGGTIVDVHSVSRIGMSDLGKNAERIKEFLAELK